MENRSAELLALEQSGPGKSAPQKIPTADPQDNACRNSALREIDRH